MTTEHTPFEIGKAQTFLSAENPQATIFATGPLVYNALVAAKEMGDEKVGVNVVNIATIKPLDRDAVIEAARQTGAIVTVEEHQIAGGLGSAIAEVLVQVHPVPIEFIGVHDQFGQSGNPGELLEHYGMGVSHIKAALRTVISRKLS